VTNAVAAAPSQPTFQILETNFTTAVLPIQHAAQFIGFIAGKSQMRTTAIVTVCH